MSECASRFKPSSLETGEGFEGGLDVVEVRSNKGLIVRPQLNRGRQSGKSIDGRPPWKRSGKNSDPGP
jgi:hypothetical protein